MAGPGADDGALRRGLEESLGLENVFMDERTRHSYATDASPCVVEPRAVVAVLSEVNAFLREKGVRFAPDPGSQELCRIGGMIGHNASGYRTVKYGQTRDHVLALRVALADGTVLDARDVEIGGPEWTDLLGRAPAIEAVHAAIESQRREILSARRPIRKHACGYDVFTIAQSL